MRVSLFAYLILLLRTYLRVVVFAYSSAYVYTRMHKYLPLFAYYAFYVYICNVHTRNILRLSRYDQYADAWDTSISCNVLGETVRYFHAKKAGVDRVFVDHPIFLSKVWGKTESKLYGAKSGTNTSLLSQLPFASLSAVLV